MIDAMQDALDDWSLLQTVTGQLDAAQTLEATLAALRAAAPAPDQAEVCLWTLDRDADDTPSTLTIVGVLPPHGRDPIARLGERHPLRKVPLAPMFLGDPEINLRFSAGRT